MMLTECPRDAMQGIKQFIPTELKIQYLNALLQANFDILDCTSFVSPKAIPQLQDVEQVLQNLNYEQTKTELQVIVLNEKGATRAIQFPQVKTQAFSLSISETFQLRNTNKTIAQAVEELFLIQHLANEHSQEVLVYLSMAFGNPYNDPYHPESLIPMVEKLLERNINRIVLADTIGCASADDIRRVYEKLHEVFEPMRFGAHFHSTPDTWKEKIQAAYNAGVIHFEGAWGGYGGCPFAKNELLGNIATQNIISFLHEKQGYPLIEPAHAHTINQLNQQIFLNYS